MQAPNWTDFLQCCICTSKFDDSSILPISLSCGHTICMRCLGKLKTRTCPYDKVPVRPDMETFPPNAALLQLLGFKKSVTDNPQLDKLSESDHTYYMRAVSAVVEMGAFLQPLAEHGITAATTYLNKPMLRKLVAVVSCQVLESEGQTRAVRAARSIADRAVTELLVMHQNQQQISTLLWTAVRNRGCQFLGPVMQEEALKLILRVLQSGNSLSRKNIVLFVVQRLSSDFPQASKTSVGHVVQLLYRASCFNVEKRDDDSSLMQLKEEFRSYECLRREHDGQIIRMAMEAGLRISPEQWSTLLYGDHKHKSDMQSIIDKLISQGAASSGLSELIVAIGRSQDPYQLSEKVVPHLEVIFKAPVTSEKSFEELEWESFATIMEALLATLNGFTVFMQIQNGRFKTGMCPHLSKPGGCPKGERCTYAHSEEERDRFRSMVKPSKPAKPRSGDQFRTSGRSSRSADHGPTRAHTDTHVTLNSYDLLQSAASTDQYPDLLHYSGEVRGHHVTAPVVLSSRREWHNVPRGGVATLDPAYPSSGETSMTSYVSADHVYPSNLTSSDHLPSYPATHTPLSNIDLLRRRHEAVKQSVEGSLYSRDPPQAPSAAAGYVVAPAPPPSGYVDTPHYPQQREWLTPHEEPRPLKMATPYSLRSDEILSSGSLHQDSLPDQRFRSAEMERLTSDSAVGGVYPIGAGFHSSQQVDSFSSSGSSSGASGPPTSVLPTSSAPPTTSTGQAQGEAATPTTSSDTGGNSQDLKAEIERLKEQLRKKDEMLQKHQLQGTSVGGAGGGVSAVAQSVVQAVPVGSTPHYSTPRHYGNGGVVLPPTTAPDPTYSTLPQATPSYPQAAPSYPPAQTPPSYPATIPYSTKQLHAAAAIAASIVQQQGAAGAGGYYQAPPPTAATPTPTPQHQWSGPQTVPTPYQPGHLVQLPPASARQPSAPFLDSSTDDMLAAYVQYMEQSKATRPTAPPYQPTPTTYQPSPAYNPQPQGQYYY